MSTSKVFAISFNVSIDGLVLFEHHLDIVVSFFSIIQPSQRLVSLVPLKQLLFYSDFSFLFIEIQNT